MPARRDVPCQSARAPGRTLVACVRQPGAAGLDPRTPARAILLPVSLSEAPAVDGEVLAEYAHRSRVDGAVPGDHAVAVRAVPRHAEIGGAVPGKFVELGERARVEQSVDPLPRGHLPPGVLSFNGPRRAGVDRLIAALLEVSCLAGGGMQVQPGPVVGPGARDRARPRGRRGGPAGQGGAVAPDPAPRGASS